MSEGWKALVFSDGEIRFTVTREQLEDVQAAWDTNDPKTIVAALDSLAIAVKSTAEQED